MASKKCPCGALAMHGRKICSECFNERRRSEYRAANPMPKSPGRPQKTRWPNVADFDATEPDFLDEIIAERAAKNPEFPKLVTRVEEHRLKRRVRDLEGELREMTEQLSDGGEMADLIADVQGRIGSAQPRIAPRERTSGLAEATPLLLASDWHIEELVEPAQVANRNRYNLQIATRRMERFFEAARWAINHQRQVPFKIRDLILWLGGDIITNFLHPDNVETNQLHPTEAILMAYAEIRRGIEYLLEDQELEQIVVPCNDGNHGRLTKKLQSASRTQKLDRGPALRTAR